jgi:transcriptional regulator with XRE-family HTH domain
MRMAKSRTLPAETLSKNLRYLLAREGWSEAELARRSKVSQKSINNAVNGVYKTKIDTAERMAEPFKLTGWDLIRPTLIQELESRGSSDKLLEAYFSANEEGQQLILSIAEREAKYRVK